MQSQVTYRVHPGQDLGQAKAAAIVAAGGTIYSMCGQAEVRVYMSGIFDPKPEGIRFNWASPGAIALEQAADFAAALSAAVEVAGEAGRPNRNLFATVPAWVATALEGSALDEELTRFYASSRYQNGDVDDTQAWRYVIDTHAIKAREEDKEHVAQEH